MAHSQIICAIFDLDHLPSDLKIKIDPLLIKMNTLTVDQGLLELFI